MQEVRLLNPDQQLRVLQQCHDILQDFLIIGESSRNHVKVLDGIESIVRSIQAEQMMKQQQAMQAQAEMAAQEKQKEEQAKIDANLRKQTEELKAIESGDAASPNGHPDIQ